MTRPISLFFILLLCCTPTLAATYKCTDAGGRRITYANVPCEEMGLKSVGPVKSLVTVLPATPAAETSGKADRAEENKAHRDEAGEGNVPSGVTVKPVSPLVEKLLN